MAGTQEELARRWAERIQAGTFSPAVLGLGTIRVMGKSGDAPVAFPRIATLDALPGLEPDEQWAVQVAMELVRQAHGQDRRVLAVQPGLGTPPTQVASFQPDASSLVVVSMIRGG